MHVIPYSMSTRPIHKLGVSEPRLQHAALPYCRYRKNGPLEVLLVTSRETKRWVVPKGWPIKGLDGHCTAAREAFEEAGLIGEVERQYYGSYRYAKRLSGGAVVDCVVRIYAMAVSEQRWSWPEHGERETRWFSLEAAAAVVHERDLAALILGLPANLH